MHLKVAISILVIAVIVIALGAVLFLYHLGTTSGTFKLPSWLDTATSSPFSFSFGSSTAGTPKISQGPGAGPTVNINGNSNYSYPTTISSGNTTSSINPALIPKGFTLAQLSPYFREVQFGTISYGTSYSYGEIALYASLPSAQAKSGQTIDITGWKIQSNRGGEYIPQAIALYDPSGLSAPSDIRVKDGDVVYLYSTSAPYNLRLNKCIGYISNSIKSSPALPNTCPYPSNSSLPNVTGACENYIQTLGGCQQPVWPNPYVPQNDYTCQDYLNNNFNYKSCFEAHLGDADFLSNQVWVWTGSNIIDQYHDTVNLFDNNGLLVAQYSY